MSRSREEQESSASQRTTLVSIGAAAALVTLKLGAGLVSGSLALVSIGIESSGDLIAAALTFFAVRLGGRPADREHPYGHRRAENLGALGEAAILLAGAIFIAVEALDHLVRSRPAPGIHAYQFIVIALALPLDAGRAVVSMRAARRFDSPALRSNAFHFAGDLAASLTALLGLLLVDRGATQADTIAALAIAVLIAASAVRLIAQNANVLMDRTPDEARAVAVRAIEALDGDVELSRLRVRESAGRYFADVVVTVPPGQAVVEGHQAANRIEAAVEAALPGSDVVVHVEPRRLGVELRQRILAIALAEPLVMEAHDVTVFQQGDATSVALHLKFPADLDLPTAAAVAGRVEEEIASKLGAAHVQTHLEPLEQTVSVAPPDADGDARAREEVARIARELTGADAKDVSVLAGEGGRVLFLTLALDARESLSAAHQLAGELEEMLRARIPDIVEVVIRTTT
jgi:cation diffusion facilitator family transporter